MIEYNCPCGNVMGLMPEMTGKTVCCPRCGREGTVLPTPAEPPYDPPAVPGQPPELVQRVYTENAGTDSEKPFYANFVATSLLPGERVLYTTRLHWIIFARPTALLVAGWILAAVLDPGSGTWTRTFVRLVIIGGLLAEMAAVLKFISAEFALTNLRVIVKSGFIRRYAIEIMLEWIEGMYVSQGIVGRLLGFGTLTIAGVGGSRGPYHRIHDPLEFRQRVQRQLAAE